MQSSSEQEALLTAFAAYSLGAYAVFQPAPYRKGTGVREPADLAWVVRDTVILFNMQRARRLERQSGHNFGQLQGWLRAWSKGTPLQGANDYAQYNVELDQVAHVLLVSVVDGPGARSRMVKVPWSASTGPEVAKRVRGTLEIPEKVLIEFARLRGTAIDLVDFALRLTQIPAGMSEDESIDDVHASHRLSVDRGLLNSDHIVETRATSDYRRWALSAITEHLKSAATRDGSGGSRDHTTLDPFTDLDWEMAATVAGVLAVAAETVQSRSDATATAAFVDVDPYTLSVGAQVLGSGPDLLEHVAQWNDRARAGEGYPLSHVTFVTSGPDGPWGGLLLALDNQTGPTVVGSALKDLQAAQRARDPEP